MKVFKSISCFALVAVFFFIIVNCITILRYEATRRQLRNSLDMVELQYGAVGTYYQYYCFSGGNGSTTNYFPNDLGETETGSTF